MSTTCRPHSAADARTEVTIAALAISLGLTLLGSVAFAAAQNPIPSTPILSEQNPDACEAHISYEQLPNEFSQALFSHQDECGTFFVQVADDFVGTGDRLIGLSWWGAYQTPDPNAQPPEYFQIEIFLREPDGRPGQPVCNFIVNDYVETRDPWQDGFMPASYCTYFPDTQEFFLEEGVQYSIAVSAALCQPSQWGWMGGQGNGEVAWTRAPEWGIDEWVPVTEVYGNSVSPDMTFRTGCMPTRVDITKSIPGWWPAFGNLTTYTSRIYWFDPRSGSCIFPGPAKIIQFDLSGVSFEKGYSLNKGTRDAMDLHFNTTANAAFVPVAITTEDCDLEDGLHDHWTSVQTSGCRSEATVYVVSEDYGAYGFIEATAFGCIGPDPSPILPREVGAPPTCTLGPARTVIPRDDNGNQIEDTFVGDTSNGNNNPTWDAETNPNPTAVSTGDGLTRYEEWRGVHTLGTHRRLSTLLKELFIYRENTAWGTDDIATTATVHYIHADEMNGARHDNLWGTINGAKRPRIVNFNRTSHTLHDQHGIWLAVSGGTGGRGNWGLARDNNGGSGGAFGPPRANGRVEVYSTNIHNASAAMGSGIFRYRTRGRLKNASFYSDGTGRENEMVNDIIGHEVGHACNLRHHATQNIWISHRPQTTADGWLDMTRRPISGTRAWTSAATRRDCVMAYPFHEIWQSVALIRRWGPSRWSSRSSTWGMLPTRAVGYGSACSVPGQPTCTRNVKIDDAD